MANAKPVRWVLLAACCVLGPFLVAQTGDQRSTKPTVVYIVRHAEKTGETPDADLSAKGKTRVEVLKWMLRDIAIDAVYSTDAPRTLHTVEPIAKEKGLSVESYVPKPGKLAETIRRKHCGQTLLVSGHSDTIPALLKSLGVPIEDNILPGYDDLFIVTLDGSAADAKGATLQRLHYPGRR
ncbi:MAG: histidine phosphatase family protein [Planctomycetes bacterium]|nr:histidine phosphatase family protein [Planctomycetota bacterium]